MANHPFHGNWTSYAVARGTLDLDGDGKIDLKFKDGNFDKGWHHLKGGTRKIELACTYFSLTEIKLKEKDRPYTAYEAKLRTDLNPKLKILAGKYVIPKALKQKGTKAQSKGRPKLAAQNDGVWVGTQP